MKKIPVKQTEANWHVQINNRVCVYSNNVTIGKVRCVFVRGLCEISERGKVSLGDSTKLSNVDTPPLKWKGGSRGL